MTEAPHKEGPRVLDDEAHRVLCLENTAEQDSADMARPRVEHGRTGAVS